MARENAPSLIFMDEIDSIGSSRDGGGGGGGDSEVQRTMLELLNQLDGFEATKNIKVIMATNRIDILDSALLRPGRIDRKIEFPPPGLVIQPPRFSCWQLRLTHFPHWHRPEARVSILRIHSRKMSLQRGINLRALAEKMGNCSGAEVRGICTEAGASRLVVMLYHCDMCANDKATSAGMYALRERRQHVTQEDFEMSVAKVRSCLLQLRRARHTALNTDSWVPLPFILVCRSCARLATAQPRAPSCSTRQRARTYHANRSCVFPPCSSLRALSELLVFSR